ncbi:MAG TPA: hypothetical protein ENH10_05300 [Bacteroidetes bacterium]|nr:hypothetical protein BMS3Bbin04_00846 [bacterium BMS3Bbin04]HDO65434.1 hypothetical protein [Bacteroidota bacterium]HEX04559.1 hypothetical protein [Bacteroidota bacterium]
MPQTFMSGVIIRSTPRSFTFVQDDAFHAPDIYVVVNPHLTSDMMPAQGLPARVFYRSGTQHETQ